MFVLISWLWILWLIESPNMSYLHLNLIDNSKISVHFIIYLHVESTLRRDVINSTRSRRVADVNRWALILVSFALIDTLVSQVLNTIHFDNLVITTHVPYANTIVEYTVYSFTKLSASNTRLITAYWSTVPHHDVSHI